MTDTYCVIVPHYNHHNQLPPVLAELGQMNLPVIVVDDGSDPVSVSAVETLVSMHPNCELFSFQPNQGKGRAVQNALRIASEKGYSHALQVDADGQHQLSDIDKLIDLSQTHPDAIVSGRPVFDDSVPKSRLHGRKLTTFCVMIETLSNDVEDAMCGFRVYPVAAVLAICNSTNIRPRMQFDAEILVHWHWRGGRLVYLPTKVRYPASGLSHFRLLRDNVHITLMHTRLIIGMLLRSPLLLGKRLRRQKKQST